MNEMNENNLENRLEQSNPEQGKAMSMTRGAFARILILVFLLGTAAAATFFILYFNVLGKGNRISDTDLAYYQELDAQFGKYYTIEKTIRDHSLYDVDDSNLDVELAEAVLGIVADDNYALYYTQEEYEAFERKYLDSYTGIGIAATLDEEGRVIVGRVIEGGPADEAGLRAGDIIVTVDGVAPTDLNDASNRLRGEAGTKVEVLIDRGGDELTFTIYRMEVEDKSVSSKKMFPDDKIAYINIASFRSGTADEFEIAVKSLKSSGYDKFIIDLRGNAGGMTNEAIDLADLLLPACKITSVRNKKGHEDISNSDSETLGISYVIVVDGDSASASELFAGAIRDNHGGKIIGSRTYGKGVVQTLYKLQDGSVIKITTDEYLLPSGDSINGVGIEPDIEVGEGEDALAVARDVLLGE